jgi:hypothetical protein
LRNDEGRLMQGTNARAFAETFLDRDRLLNNLLTRLQQCCL